MPHPAIHEFGKALVRHVRDEAIKGCDMHFRPDVRFAAAKRWQAAVPAAQRPAVDMIISDCVDQAVASLLIAIDQGLLHVKVVASDGKEIDLTTEGNGELCGWYMGTDGWRHMFSTERFVDDCADLSANPPRRSVRS
jgi:hypothetical protein